VVVVMVAPTHNRPDTEIVVVMVVMPPLDGHRGIMRSDGGDASPRRTQRYYEEWWWWRLPRKTQRLYSGGGTLRYE